MGFFTRDEGKKEDPPKKAESERILPKPEPKPVAPKKTGASLKTFVLGLRASDKLATLPPERFEEGLRAVFPKGTRVVLVAPPQVLDRDDSLRFFEVGLAQGDMTEALTTVLDKGLLDGLVTVNFDQCVVVCEAVGKSAQVAITGETIDRSGMRFTVKSESPEVLVQYPPMDVHRRWLADDDYRAAYGRWRTQRSDEAKPPRWHAGWAPASDDAGPPWVKLKALGKPDEYVLDFEDSMLLRFAFQGAVIRIERFNLKILTNKLTGESALYRSLPLSFESIPKDVQDRMNREPDRFRQVRETGRFGASFDLVRTAYEELGGDYHQLELPASPPISPVTSPPVVPLTTQVPPEPVSLQSGPISRPESVRPVEEVKKALPPPRMGTPLSQTTGSGQTRSFKPQELPRVETPRVEEPPRED
jgi:hypothetical protein